MKIVLPLALAVSILRAVASLCLVSALRKLPRGVLRTCPFTVWRMLLPPTGLRSSAIFIWAWMMRTAKPLRTGDSMFGFLHRAAATGDIAEAAVIAGDFLDEWFQPFSAAPLDRQQHPGGNRYLLVDRFRREIGYGRTVSVRDRWHHCPTARQIRHKHAG